MSEEEPDDLCAPCASEEPWPEETADRLHEASDTIPRRRKRPPPQPVAGGHECVLRMYQKLREGKFARLKPT